MADGKLVYHFGGGQADGGKDDKQLLGGKGADLHEMTRIGLPVPPGFTISTEACLHFLDTGDLPAALEAQVSAAVDRLEALGGRGFGDRENPLLLSVRSGAAVSMPGMMDTVLDLGLNDRAVEGLAQVTGDARFAYDAYRRLLQMYGNVVLAIPDDRFEELLAEKRAEEGVDNDAALSAAALKGLAEAYKDLVKEEGGAPFPQNPREQLRGAVRAVFESWNTDRARAYRRVNDIPDDLGTAANVMTMVYGNRGDDSGSGVAFTRDPSSGERKLYGEFLRNAQGEDVVAGIRNPLPIAELERAWPAIHGQLAEVCRRLEGHYRDMQDLEFTVERGELYILQTRTGKRTATAAVKIAVDMVDEGLIDEDEAVLRVDADQAETLLHPRLDPEAEAEELATGLAASPGAAAGRVVFDPDEAAARGASEAVILVQTKTSPEAFHGMAAARAILTSRGGMTSHAAVVARGMGKPCVAGAQALEIHEGQGWLTADGRRVRHDDWITVDGGSGRVLLGRVPTVEPELSDDFRRLMGWADARRTLKVRANADTPGDARRARELGAQGIGLCRTEHMFFGEERISVIRETILAEDDERRCRALERLLPMQRRDFRGIFEAMDGLPVTIRLLDPPLHEFLPETPDEMTELAESMGMDVDGLAAMVQRHVEANPMLGHRGVRVGISHPEITAMQVRAIMEAALDVADAGGRPTPEIMIPLVGFAEELRRQLDQVRDSAEEVFRERGRRLRYEVGTMIELPRAALTAGEIATLADFFSFGTNDLTQTTLGMSRDDAGSFLPLYLKEGIVPADPFRTLDREGVGRLVALAVQEGRDANPDLHVGVCGEHGGDGRSVGFFHEVGVDYVSCSPYRVPVARLAAAQAALGRKASSTSRPSTAS